MKLRFTATLRTAIATSLLIAATPSFADEASPETKKEIVAMTQELMDALVPGKADVWQRDLADDAMIIDEFGRRQTKKEIVESVHPFPTGLSGSIELRDTRVHVYGDTAVLDCEEYETETVFGQKLVVRYFAMNTYVRQYGAWKIVAMEDVTLPTVPPKLDVQGLTLSDYTGMYKLAPDHVWIVDIDNGKLQWRTKAGRPASALDPIAKDVFMGGDDEKNLMIFRRDGSGHIVELIERRKYNDLHLSREKAS